jgi:hypothetical protein
MMSDSSLFWKADRDRLSPSNLMLLLKCLYILQSLPEVALKEAAENLEGIADFYTDYSPQASLPSISTSTIKGTLKSTQIRPPIVLEP